VARPRSTDRPKRRGATASLRAPEGAEIHQASATAVAAEALRTGVVPGSARFRRVEIPREDETIRVGDPDDRSLVNEYVGEDTPGATCPTPDQNNVDDIGRAYGLQEEDTGALRSVGEVLARRDHRRAELRPPGRTRA
jgi:hypothetical protein